MDNHVAIGRPMAQPQNAVAGFEVFLEDGRIPSDLRGHAYLPGPRTAAALDRSGRLLLLAAADGRQPNYSEGITLIELAEILLSRGGWTAINLDGGGSSTLAVEGPGGRPMVLNSPCHGGIPPGRERPVANHLGVFARRR